MKKIAIVKDFNRDGVKWRGVYINGLINTIFLVENEEHQQQYLNHLNYLRNLGYKIAFD